MIMYHNLYNSVVLVLAFHWLRGNLKVHKYRLLTICITRAAFPKSIVKLAMVL